MTTGPKAVFRPRIEGDVLTVFVAGLVTYQTMRELRQLIFGQAISHDVRRVLVDLECAMMLLTEDAWLACEHDASHFHMPTAILVPAECLPAAHRFCVAANALGRICLAFSDAATAYLWAGVPYAAPPLAACPESQSLHARSQLRGTTDQQRPAGR